MIDDNKYHYVYRITWNSHRMHYYGSRSSDLPPNLDLGIRYFSSSSNQQFIDLQRSNPSDFSYKILFTTKTKEEAVSLETTLHRRVDVARRTDFINKANQTNSSFTYSTGRPMHGEYQFVNKKTGELVYTTPRDLISSGKVSNHIYEVIAGRLSHSGGWYVSDIELISIESVCLNTAYTLYHKKRDYKVIGLISDLATVLNTHETNIKWLIAGKHKSLYGYQLDTRYRQGQNELDEMFELVSPNEELYLMSLQEMRDFSDPEITSPYQLIDGTYKTSNGWRLASTSREDAIPRTRKDITLYDVYSKRESQWYTLSRDQLRTKTSASESLASLFLSGEVKSIGIQGYVLDESQATKQDFSVYHFYNHTSCLGFIGNKASFIKEMAVDKTKIKSIMKGTSKSGWTVIHCM